jgi:hypothetical protein
MWNPDADVDALVRDFTDGYYGAGGRYVREYLDLEERVLRREGIHGNCYISAMDSMYTQAFLDEGRALFAKAREAVGTDSVLYHRLETAEFPLCFLQMEKDPLLGLQTGADALARRVIRRDGITRMAEWESGSGTSGAEVLLECYDQMKRDLREVAVLPASPVEPAGNGVAFTRYEGGFMTTGEMLRKGKMTGKGIRPDIRIEEPEEADHFGYVFDTWLKVTEEGVHQIRVSTDDGAVLLLDGKAIIERDGSHSAETAWAYVDLAAGFHHLELRYFEDCEGQELDIRLRTPAGYDGPLPQERLFIVKE